MIKGSKIILRTVREADLDTLFELMSNVSNRGDYFPIYLRSEPLTKKEFHETGFWSDLTFGRNSRVSKIGTVRILPNKGVFPKKSEHVV